MSIVRFCVIFDKPDKVYKPGEIVTGRVELVLHNELKIKAVEMKIKGKAKCDWYEQQGRVTIRRKSSETYLNSKQILFGGNFLDIFKMFKGVHDYPFAVMLPPEAPPTFSGFNGGIKYYGKAKIIIPFGTNKKERSEFTVISPLNLNLFPNLRTPFKKEKTNKFYWLFGTKGPLTLTVYLPKTGFATFESIPITIEINNASNVTINAVHLYLRRTINWLAEGYEEPNYLKLLESRLDGVEAGQSRTWNENFTIPPVSFPNLEDCSIIKMDHKLHIEVDPSGMHNTIDMYIPVTIGDILLSEDPNAPIITPQMQTSPNNIARNSGIQNPARGLPSTYPNPNPPVWNYPYPQKSGSTPHKIPPLQISSPLPGHVVSQLGMNYTPSNPDFVAPNLHQNTGGNPQMSTQKNSISVQQYPPQAPPALSSLSLQPATNPECSQITPHLAVTEADVEDRVAFLSFNRDVQSEKTSGLNDSKEDDEHIAFERPFFTQIVDQSGVVDRQSHKSIESQDNLDTLSAQLLHFLENLDQKAAEL